ncbi:MAG: UxaA family hydrolase [Eubacteriales bacterium]
MEHKFLIHDPKDSVGVAVDDINAGETIRGVILENNSTVEIKSISDIPLGHKIALADIEEGDQVIKYNVSVGRATKAIAKGEHVHTHNLKTARW